MRKIILGIMAGILMPISFAFANVESDLTEGLSLEEIFTNAIAEEVTIDDALILVKEWCQVQDSSELIPACNAEVQEAAVLAAITGAEATAAGNPNAATPANPNGPGVPATPAIPNGGPGGGGSPA